jgi:hypothetical protein
MGEDNREEGGTMRPKIMARIRLVPKEKLYPAFGMSYSSGRIEIRNDLPKNVRLFVQYHELYHLRDKATNWLWREIKANCYAFLKCPLGGILTVILSLHPDRLKYYWSRFKKGE